MSMPPLTVDINPIGLVKIIWRWIKSRNKEKYTFSEYFKKIQKDFGIKNLDETLKGKILGMIDQKELPDGRQIVVDYSRRRILIRKFD